MSSFYTRYPHLNVTETSHECEEAYGFLPCSNSIGGSAFLIFVYGYILLQGATLLSDGSELLMELNLGPGIVGGLVLPCLGAMPDSIIIVVAGLLCSKQDAQEQVAVGVGTLAGSTIMLLTAAWSGSVLLGRCDFDSKVPATLGYAQNPTAALLGCITCFLALFVYCIWQILSPELKRRQVLAAKMRSMRSAAVRSLTYFLQNRYGGLLDSSGAVNYENVQKLFTRFDRDDSGSIDRQELHALLLGLELASDGTGAQVEEHIDHWMREFGCTDAGVITLPQFYTGLSRWVREKQDRAKDRRRSSNSDPHAVLLRMPSEITEPLVPIEEGAGDSDSEAELEVHSDRSPAAIALESVAKMAAGCIVCAFFADPLVGAVSSFSAATGIPAFFVAFVVNPLASNASELVSSLRYAATKRSKNISVTFSQVYGAVTMNNTMCLGFFLLVVYVQELSWNYTAEVLVMVIPTLMVGLIGVSHTSIPTYLGIAVLFIYPVAIVVNWVLVNVLYLDGKP